MVTERFLTYTADSIRIAGGYHGYAVRLGQFESSLQLIAGLKPDFPHTCMGPCH